MHWHTLLPHCLFWLSARTAVLTSNIHDKLDLKLGATGSIDEVIHTATRMGLTKYQPPHRPEFKEWIALGDSYAAGIGADDIHDQNLNSSTCYRFDNSYPRLMQKASGYHGLTFAACSRDRIADVTDNQLLDYVVRVDDNSYIPFGHPEFATLAVGLDDIGMDEIFNVCFFGLLEDVDCDDLLQVAEERLRGGGAWAEMVGTLLSVLIKGQQAGGASPVNAFSVFVSGHPRVFNAGTAECDDVRWSISQFVEGNKVDRALRRRINGLVDALNDVIQNVVEWLADQGYGVFYVDGHLKKFEGHRLCERGSGPEDQSGENVRFWSPQSWWMDESMLQRRDLGELSRRDGMWDLERYILDALRSPGLYRVFHPKSQGYRLYAAANVEAIERARRERVELW